MDVETLDAVQAPEAVEPAVVENATETPETETDDEMFSPDDLPGEEVEAAEGEVEGEVEPAAEPEFAKIEFDGQEYEVPPVLKDAFMRNKDYTQKNQARAERERELEARAQTLQQRETLTEAEQQAQIQLYNIEGQLQDYQQFTQADWNSLEMEDPIGAQQHWRNYQMLKDQGQQAMAALQNARQEKQTLMQSEATKRWESTEKYAKQNIPGWNKEMDAQIREFAADQLKFPAEQFTASVNENVYKALHLAWVGAKTLAKQPQPGSVAAKLKPTTRLSAKAGATSDGDPANMSMAEYATWAAKKFKD